MNNPHKEENDFLKIIAQNGQLDVLVFTYTENDNVPPQDVAYYVQHVNVLAIVHMDSKADLGDTLLDDLHVKISPQTKDLASTVTRELVTRGLTTVRTTDMLNNLTRLFDQTSETRVHHDCRSMVKTRYIIIVKLK